MNRVHYGAVVVAGIAMWIVQACWYIAFGNQWAMAVGFTPDQMANAKANPSFYPYIISLIANCVIAYMLSMIMVRTGGASIGHGLRTAFALWMGFVATILLTNYSFEMKPFSLFVINGGSSLVGMLVEGVIVGAWKKS